MKHPVMKLLTGAALGALLLPYQYEKTETGFQAETFLFRVEKDGETWTLESGELLDRQLVAVRAALKDGLAALRKACPACPVHPSSAPRTGAGDDGDVAES